ncbi:TPA: hypothetical protein HA278_02935 [Candidatus Woesearchaeota archaeon]|nr:hypothetical protein [archaeon]HIJ10989.1 hypothetical protein [Candidatus Woesearchaeota archaeon]|tara:strand:- start:1607 stop:2371 length:765 start_codon:yes stop_codon:yes gene_type:complete
MSLLGKMEQTQDREYRDFTSLLSGERVSLPYSGEYENPAYQSGASSIVHGYDIGGTLASAQNRDIAIREILGLEDGEDIKSSLFVDSDVTRRVSTAQEEGIKTGKIKVDALDGVVEQLSEERDKGEDRALVTVGTYQMARSFIYGAGLEDYVTALTTSEEAGTGNQKTVEMFVDVYERLKERGKTMKTYCDDSERDAKAAVEASKIIEERYDDGFTIFLVKRDAEDEEVGLNQDGYIVIRSIRDKSQFVGLENE